MTPKSVFRPTRRLSALTLAVALACLAPSAHALRIGAAEVRSALGQPLDLVLPVYADGDASFQPECVRVLRDAPGDGIPGPGLTRLEIEPRGADYLVRVRSAQPVFEPAIKLVLEAGCAQRVRRDFVLLLDPPVARETAPTPIELPLVLGEAVVMSNQGEPLRMRVPVSGRDAGSLDPACVAVSTQPGGAAQTLVRRSGNATTLLISTAAPLEATRVGVSVQAGCNQSVLRDYSLLLAAPALASAGGPAPAGAPRAARSPAPRKPAAARPASTGANPTVAAAAAAGAAEGGAAPEAGRRPSQAGDRLVLAEPAAPSLNEREQAIAAQVEALSKEMAQLRVELAEAQARNLELLRLQANVAANNAAAAPKESPSYAWIFAAIAASALGLGLLIAWRQRRPAEGGWADDHPDAGPATRLGLAPGDTAVARAAATVMPPTQAPAAPRSRVTRAAPAAASGVAAGSAASVAGAPQPAPAEDDHAIHVTEFANTGQLIEDLYADYLESPAPAAAPASAAPTPVRAMAAADTVLGPAPSLPTPAPVAAVVPPPAPVRQTMPPAQAPRVDLDLGSNPETMPMPKTELAIDLDVGTLALPTQVLDDWDQSLFAPAKDKSAAPADAVPAAPTGPLSPVDFELSIELPGAATKPPKPAG